MRKLILGPLLLLASLLFVGTAAAAGPVVITPAVENGKVTSQQTIQATFDVSEPATTGDLVAAPVALGAVNGFTIVDVTGPGLVGATMLPSADWLGELDLADGDSTTITVTLRAPSGIQAASTPLAIGIGGQSGPDVTAATPDVAVVAPLLTLARTGSSGQVFPKNSAGVTATLADVSGLAWTSSAAVQFTVPAGLAITNTPAGLSGMTWTAGPVGALATTTLPLVLTVGEGATGSPQLSAAGPGGSNDQQAIPIAPIPTVAITAPAPNLIAGGPNGVLTVTVTNSATVATGAHDIKLTIPAGLTFVAASPGSGVYSIPNKIWTVSLAAGESESLDLTLKATATVAAPFVADYEGFYVQAVSQSITVDPPSDPNPVAVVTGPAQTFPGRNAVVKVKVTNQSNAPADIPVVLSLESGLSFVSSDNPGAVSGLTWTPNIDAGASVTLTLTLAVGLNASGSLNVLASPQGGTADTFAVTVAPRPVVAIDPPGAPGSPTPLVVGGPAKQYKITIDNSASVSTGALTVDVTLPAAIAIESASTGAGNGTFNTGTRVWSVTAGAGATVTLSLFLKANDLTSGSLTVALGDFGVAPVSQAIGVVTDGVTPAASVTGSTAAVFPTTTTTASVTLTNRSKSPLEAMPVTLQLGAGLTVVASSAPLSSLTWSAPALAAEASVTLELTLRVDAGTPAGPAVIKATPQITGGESGQLTVPVAPIPTPTVTVPDPQLLVGGPVGVIEIGLANTATIATGPLNVAVRLPAGLALSSAVVAPGNTFEGGIWSVAINKGSSAVLRLAVSATDVPTAPLVVDVGAFGVPSLSTVIPVNRPVPGTPTDVRVVPPPSVLQSSPLPAAPETLSVDIFKPRRVGTAYTFRGEVKYRGAALTKTVCGSTKLELVVRKTKGAKILTGKPADRAGVQLVFADGHCLFATRYAFFKRFRGKGYRFEFTARSKRSLPLSTGGVRKPAPATTGLRITVGK